MAERKGSLSSNILGMKFMKRVEEAEKRSQLEKEAAEQIEKSKWIIKENVKGLAIEDATNFVFSRKTGRRSFGNFNPEIEKLNKILKLEESNNGKKIRNENEDLNDTSSGMSAMEMTERFSTFVGAPSESYGSQGRKRQSSSNKTNKKEKKRKTSNVS